MFHVVAWILDLRSAKDIGVLLLRLRVTIPVTLEFHVASVTLLCLWLGRVDNDDRGRKTEMFCADEIIPMLNNIKVNFHLCIDLPLKFKIA